MPLIPPRKKPAPEPDDGKKEPAKSPAEKMRDAEDLARFDQRFAEALHAGMPFEDAECFARSGIDVGDLRRLVKGGCDGPLLGRILL